MTRAPRQRVALAVALALAAASCGASTDDASVAGGGTTTSAPAGRDAATTAPTAAPAPDDAAPAPTTAPVSTSSTASSVPPGPGYVARPGIDTAIGRFPERVYVPNTISSTVQVIDPATFEIVDEFPVGQEPHHITPSWGMDELYVMNTQGDTLTVLDPTTGTPSRTIPVEDPYNLYFTPDGTKAVVVAERLRRLDVRDPATWALIGSIPIGPNGVDHGAFTSDGRYLVLSTEYDGVMVKVDLQTLQVVAELPVQGFPIDVVRSPVSELMYVANQWYGGVHVIDPITMQVLQWIPTGDGAHGILMSRDRTKLYVSNRLAGTISVLDVATDTIVDTWDTGGSPDMGMLNPDGTQLWIANRYHSSVMAIDTRTGQVIARIPTGDGPHGVTYFPMPGTHSVGHNGVTIDR